MSKTSQTLIAITMAIAVLVAQIGPASAAPTLQNQSISGTVTAVTCETDPITGDKTFQVTIEDANGLSQKVLIDQLTATVTLQLVPLTADGSPDCSPAALEAAAGMGVTIDAADILSEEEAKHPVGDALATFFEGIADYDTIMVAHEGGLEFGKFGFGVIAQALWLTKNMSGDSDTFIAILEAKATGDYSAFTFEEGLEVPQNWGQFRKAVLSLDEDQKINLGTVMSGKENDNGSNVNIGNGQGDHNGNNQNNGHPNQTKNKTRENEPGNSENKGNSKNK